MTELQAIEKILMRLLARREHSQEELRRKLLARQFNEDNINLVLEAFAKKNLQSDARFVENYIEARAKKGYGPIRIRQELGLREVSDDLIETYLQYDWIKLAKHVRIKKFGNKIPKDFESRATQMKFLQYRGFTADQIKTVFTT